jgi:hypothetical protein
VLHKLHKFHPGLVGAAAGFGTGALYSIWWLGWKPADVGLSDAEAMWLLVVTVAVIVCFPLLMTYFAYYSVRSLQTDLTKSASDSWKTIAVIVFSLSFGYSLSFIAVINEPGLISTATMWSLFVGYGAIISAMLYLIYKVPWVNWGRVVTRDSSAAKATGDRDSLEPKATAMDTKER